MVSTTYESSWNTEDVRTFRQAVQDFIRSAVACIPEVSASAVAVPGLSEAACRAVAESLGARFRWRPFDAIGRLAPAAVR